jgi:hypothetical protein
MTLYNDTGLSDEVTVLEDALVVSPGTDGDPCGVLDAEGCFCDFSREFRRPRKASPKPDLRQLALPEGRLDGTYLYAGWLHPHFGHFLLESTVRLWALDEWHDKLDGLLFIPLKAKTFWRARKSYANVIDLLSGGLGIVRGASVQRVERLVVPDPGWGHEARMRGSPRFRRYSRARIAQSISSEGGENLYISRTALPQNRGGVIAEERIEEMMADEGYEIFHPQRHSVETQLARYRAARNVVCLDGSALHLASLALEPRAKVAIIYRRRGALLPRLTEHVRLFSGADVHGLDLLREIWVDRGADRVDYRAMGEVDFVGLHRNLHDLGFIRTRTAPDNMTASDIQNYLTARERPDMVPFGLRA